KGFGGDNRSVTSATSDASASWTFSGLVPQGVYEVAVTWPTTGFQGNAAFTIVDGTREIYQGFASQYYIPGDFTDAGVGWMRLETVQSSGGTLTVRLTAPVGGPLVADAVRIRRLTGDG